MPEVYTSAPANARPEAVEHLNGLATTFNAWRKNGGPAQHSMKSIASASRWKWRSPKSPTSFGSRRRHDGPAEGFPISIPEPLLDRLASLVADHLAERMAPPAGAVHRVRGRRRATWIPGRDEAKKMSELAASGKVNSYRDGGRLLFKRCDLDRLRFGSSRSVPAMTVLLFPNTKWGRVASNTGPVAIGIALTLADAHG